MLHYTRQGTGQQPLVMIHGFLGSTEVFDKVVEPLSEAFDIIRVDLPGHGKSAMDQEQYSVYDYAQAVQEVLEHENVADAIWLGHSLGGYVVLAALEKEIAKMPRAILAYSSHVEDDLDARKKRLAHQHSIRYEGVRTYVDEHIKAFFRKNAKQREIDAASQIAYKADPKGLVVALEAMKQRSNQQKLIDELQMPMLVIEGSEDHIVEPVDTDNLNVEMALTHAGHLGMLENPREFIQTILEWDENER